MIIAVMTEVWRRSRHSGSHLLMMLALADFSDDKGCSYPAVSTLATKCRMKPRNANVVLAALRESKELEVKPNAGPHGVNRYRIVLSALGAPLQQDAGVQGIAGVQAGTGVQSDAGAASADTLQGNAGTPAKACSIPLQTVADKPSLNRQEPSKKKARERAPSFDAISIEMPDWLNAEDWAMWVRHRVAIRKPLSEDGARLALRALDKLRAQGFAPIAVIEHGVASGNQGLFPPPGAQKGQRGSSAHAGFESRDYRKGVDENGRFTG